MESQPMEQSCEPPSKSFIFSAPIPAVNLVEKPAEIKPIPLRNGKPLVEFTPEMNSSQRQAVIIAKMNELQDEYREILKLRKRIIKRIMKRKRKMVNNNTDKNIISKRKN
ncbi:uncharacterized protein LOC112592895 [Melanaphis sacchari]|uniref:uncharacterized protein LOC112592895 n=1 Tax=Melanaphis sacchari TaxID=742174 RepID=UPI000DC15280|nr:uncharacterized protein LOC112592895 [Melanaphis sacchari]